MTDHRWSGVTSASLSNIAAASLALHGSPEAALLAAAIAPPLEEGIGAAIDAVRSLVRGNQQAVLRHAAATSTLSAEQVFRGAI